MRVFGAALSVVAVLVVGGPPAASFAGDPLLSGDLSLALEVGPGRFKTSEPIPLELTVRVRASGDVPLSFATAQRFDFRIEDIGGQTLWQWSGNRAFAQVLGQVRLSPERPELRYRVTAAPKLPPGRYRVHGWLTSSPPTAQAAADIVIE